MTRGLPPRVAIAFPVLSFALTCVQSSPPALAEPRNSETDRPPAEAFERFLSGITQCEAENNVAQQYGGAIKRRNLADCAKVRNHRRLDEGKNKLHPPVTGEIVRLFGEKDREDRILLGITFQTDPGASVVAPFDATITFAGPVENHGQTLILSTGGGYHFVLAGMTKIYGVEDQKVLEGEPVGVMGVSAENVPNPDVPGAPGIGDASNATVGPELYFEIRKNQKPIDPLPWLATARLERTLR